MAEVLVIAGRGPNGIGTVTAWRDEDPVDVRPDGYRWGAEERNPLKFRIVKFPGIPVSRFAHLFDEHRDARYRRKFRIQGRKVVDRATSHEDLRHV